MSELTYKRGIAEVTRDIRIKTGQFLMDAIEIGRLLYEAKSMVEPGNWGKYVEEELPFSHSWANNYMRLYKELGGEQLSMFGNSTAIMNLSPTKALELLVLPEQQREEFLESHDVESMSSRELHQAIKDLEAAEARARDAEQNVLDMQQRLSAAKTSEGAWAEEINKLKAAEKKAEDEKDAAIKDAQEKEAQLRRAEANRNELEKELDGLKRKLQEAREKEQDALDLLKQVKENPVIPESVMEQMRQEADAAAAANAREETEKKLAEARGKLDAAESAVREAEAKLAAAQKEAKLSNPNVVIFKTIMGQIQDDFNRMNGVLLKAQQEDPTVAENLKQAFLGLLDKLKEAI